MNEQQMRRWLVGLIAPFIVAIMTVRLFSAFQGSSQATVTVSQLVSLVRSGEVASVSFGPAKASGDETFQLATKDGNRYVGRAVVRDHVPDKLEAAGLSKRAIQTFVP